MITDQFFDITIKIPKSHFGDVDDFLMDTLKKSYESTCYGGYWIKEVIGVLYRSRVEINNSDLQVDGMVSARVHFHAVKLVHGEFLANCEVKMIDNNTIKCHKDLIVTIQVTVPEKKFKWITKGSFIPVVINHVHFGNGEEMAFSVCSILSDFENHLHNVLYLVKKMPSTQDYEYVAKRIRILEPQAKKSGADLKKLMPKFHGGKPLLKEFKSHNLTKSLPEIKGDMIVQYPSVADDNIYVMPASSFKSKNIPVVADNGIIMTMLYQRLAYLTGILDLSKQKGKDLKEYFN